jgi:hypothetical protein
LLIKMMNETRLNDSWNPVPNDSFVSHAMFVRRDSICHVSYNFFQYHCVLLVVSRSSAASYFLKI